MIKRLLLGAACAACCLTSSAVIADQTRTDQGAEFNFDTDNSGDFKLKRSTRTNVLELATFYIYVSSEGQLRELDGAVDDGNDVKFNQQTGIDSFDPLTQQGVANGYIDASLVFTSFTQTANGDAQLNYRLNISGGGIHSNGSPTMVSLFAAFDYAGSGDELSIIRNGGIAITDVGLAPGEGPMFISSGNAPHAGMLGMFDSAGGPFDMNAFMSSASINGTNLVGGHWMQFEIPGDISGNAQDFTFSMSGSLTAIPEPAAGAVGGLLAAGFVLRRRRR